MATFDRHLILKIISYSSYRCAFRCRRLSKFFASQIASNAKGFFWESYCQNRQSPETKKVKYIYSSAGRYKKMAVTHCSDKEDLDSMFEHFLWRHRNSKRILQIKYDNMEIFKSAYSHWLDYNNEIDMYNKYSEQLEEDSPYNEDGVRYSVLNSLPHDSYDDSFYSTVDKRFIYMYPNDETITYEEIFSKLNNAYSDHQPEQPRKPVIRALPDKILGKIFGLCFDADYSRLNVILVCKKFQRVVLNFYPPSAEIGLLHACRQNHVNYFKCWMFATGNNNKKEIKAKMFEEACNYSSLDILDYFDDMSAPAFLVAKMVEKGDLNVIKKILMKPLKKIQERILYSDYTFYGDLVENFLFSLVEKTKSSEMIDFLLEIGKEIKNSETL